MAALKTLVADDHAVATLEAETRLVRYARTTTPFATLEDMRTHYAELLRVAGTIHPEKLRLLFDVRAAPPRNDKDFETEVAQAVGVVLDRFERHAFLVKTAVGSLQVRRISTARGAPETRVFTDEASALAFLAS